MEFFDEVYERSLQFDWDKLRRMELPLEKQVESSYKATYLLQQFAQHTIIPVLGGQLRLTDVEKAYVVTFYRTYMWLGSMVNLNALADIQAVAAATRSVFELLLDLKSLAADETLAEKYHAFCEVERYRAVEKLVEFLDAHPGVDRSVFRAQIDCVGDSNRQGNVENLMTKHWGRDRDGRPNRPTHWTGKGVYSRAKDAGEEYEEYYRSAYPQLSWFAHAGSPGVWGIAESGFKMMFALWHGDVQRFVAEAFLVVGERFHLFDAAPQLRDTLGRVQLASGLAAWDAKMDILEELQRRTDEQEIPANQVEGGKGEGDS